MGNTDPLPGNIYQVLAFEDGGLRKYKDNSQLITRDIGFLIIWVIQVVGPPAIFLSTVFGWGIYKREMYKWSEWHPDLYDWHHIALTKTLSLFLILGFCLNTRYIIFNEHRDFERMDTMFRYLQKHTEAVLGGQSWIWAGSLANCWVVVWCCLDSLIIIAAATNPKDILFDSLGLFFLYNLDDLGSDFAFATDDNWPGQELAWICENMVEEQPGDTVEGESQESDVDDDRDLVYDEKLCSSFMSDMVRCVYGITEKIIACCVLVLPTFTSITSFTKIIPQ